MRKAYDPSPYFSVCCIITYTEKLIIKNSYVLINTKQRPKQTYILWFVDSENEI